jgi:hypothetical protein
MARENIYRKNEEQEATMTEIDLEEARGGGTSDWIREQYIKIQDYVIHNRLYPGQPRTLSCADIIVSELSRVREELFQETSRLNAADEEIKKLRQREQEYWGPLGKAQGKLITMLCNEIDLIIIAATALGVDKIINKAVIEKSKQLRARIAELEKEVGV